ncbi:hypothetical protein BTVI_62383 [Pitangus sulphuratus]|nr:hypothetical protein BTVI_62383 [Pitangus sulphuratus]
MGKEEKPPPVKCSIIIDEDYEKVTYNVPHCIELILDFMSPVLTSDLYSTLPTRKLQFSEIKKMREAGVLTEAKTMTTPPEVKGSS